MADNPPYMMSYGTVPKILDKVKAAKTPQRFTNDFLYSKLGFKSNSARPFVRLAKRLNLLSEDGTPTDLYKSFRSTNVITSQGAMASAIKHGYADLYMRNEYVHDLEKDELKGLIIEATGLEPDNAIVGAIVSTFESLKGYANFDVSLDDEIEDEDGDDGEDFDHDTGNGNNGDSIPFQMGLNYTINLVLPKTDDVAVFNAIFKSLRENLLRK